MPWHSFWHHCDENNHYFKISYEIIPVPHWSCYLDFCCHLLYWCQDITCQSDEHGLRLGDTWNTVTSCNIWLQYHKNTHRHPWCTCLEHTWSILIFNSSPPGQNGHHFADDIVRRIFVKENACILIKISLKSVPSGPIHNNPALV